MTIYVVKCDGKYCAFGSYMKARLVDNPLKASIYSTRVLAEKRLGYAYINKKQRTDLTVAELKMKVISEKNL